MRRTFSTIRKRIPSAWTTRARPGQTLPLAALLLVMLLLVIGLAVDSGRLLLARRSLQASVDAAAHAGAQQIDVAHLRATGELRLDAAAAAAAARAMLAADGLGDVEVGVGAGRVAALARARVPLTLLRLAPGVGAAAEVEAVGVGEPRRPGAP
ncbi:MAG: pilus assembly protein [Chloroflexi bacterium]|nr:pilus assembly protein [Chloroflexota bacterium]